MLNLKLTPLPSKVVGLLNAVRAWAESRPDISAVALAGSQAHGKARPDSDIDLVILSDSPDDLRKREWLTAFGSFPDVITEQWGVMTTHRVTYEQHGEVEVGVAHSNWADIPVDAGTYRVVHDGIIIVYDPRAALQRLIAEVLGGSGV